MLLNNGHTNGKCHSIPRSVNFYVLQTRKPPYFTATTSQHHLSRRSHQLSIWECGLTTNLHGMIIFNIIITHKAAQVNGFLYHNLRQCPPHIKITCYKSMVCPILEYASPVWDPHTNVNIQKLESVQRRAARFCSGDFSRYSSLTSMLLLLDLPSLESKRKLAKLTTMYKLINGNLHIPSNSLIPNHRDSRDRYFMQLQCRTDSYKFSFSLHHQVMELPPPL